MQYSLHPMTVTRTGRIIDTSLRSAESKISLPPNWPNSTYFSSRGATPRTPPCTRSPTATRSLSPCPPGLTTMDSTHGEETRGTGSPDPCRTARGRILAPNGVNGPPFGGCSLLGHKG